MPQVTVKSGIEGRDGREEQITEYICDSPGCPNVATQVVGHLREIRVLVALCEEHAAKFRTQT